jgi:hypothetical protein
VSRDAKRWLVLALAALLVSCEEGETSILIVVDSDLAIPADVDQLQFVIVGASSGATIDRTFDVETPWPHSLSVRPRGDDAEGVSVTVTARKRPAAEAVVTQTVSTAFEPGVTVTVPVVRRAPACRAMTMSGVRRGSASRLHPTTQVPETRASTPRSTRVRRRARPRSPREVRSLAAGTRRGWWPVGAKTCAGSSATAR